MIICLLQLGTDLRDPDHPYHMTDYVDGQAQQQHPLFTIHKEGFQIIFYYDDVEVCNPLGSKAKIHKLSKLYNYTELWPKLRLLETVQIKTCSIVSLEFSYERDALASK